jgi:hypothetical protein
MKIQSVDEAEFGMVLRDSNDQWWEVTTWFNGLVFCTFCNEEVFTASDVAWPAEVVSPQHVNH